MKKQFTIPHSFIFIFIIILLVSLSIAVIQPNHPHQAPPPAEDIKLQVGSTDGITVLAFLISGIILIPLTASGALNRKKKPPQK